MPIRRMLSITHLYIFLSTALASFGLRVFLIGAREIMAHEVNLGRGTMD